MDCGTNKITVHKIVSLVPVLRSTASVRRASTLLNMLFVYRWVERVLALNEPQRFGACPWYEACFTGLEQDQSSAALRVMS